MNGKCKMLKTKKLKIYIENQTEFKKKVNEELELIQTGKLKTMKEDSISFQSLEQLRKYLTPKRLELVRIIRYKKPKSIYELAKFANRTPENVNSDIKLLKNMGFVQISKVKNIRKKIVPSVNYDSMSLEINI